MTKSDHEGQYSMNQIKQQIYLELPGFAGDIGFTLKRSLQEKVIIIRKGKSFLFDKWLT